MCSCSWQQFTRVVEIIFKKRIVKSSTVSYNEVLTAASLHTISTLFMNEEKFIDFRGKVRHHPRLHFPQLFSLLYFAHSPPPHTTFFFFIYFYSFFFAIAINNQFHKSDSLTRRSLLLKRWWKFSCSSSFHTKYAKCWRGSFLCWDGKKINAAPRKKGTKSLVFTLHFTQSHHIQMLLLLLLFPFFTLL